MLQTQYKHFDDGSTIEFTMLEPDPVFEETQPPTPPSQPRVSSTPRKPQMTTQESTADIDYAEYRKEKRRLKLELKKLKVMHYEKRVMHYDKRSELADTKIKYYNSLIG